MQGILIGILLVAIIAGCVGGEQPASVPSEEKVEETITPPPSTPAPTPLTLPPEDVPEAEMWKTVTGDGVPLPVIRGKYADAEVVELDDGMYRIYYAGAEENRDAGILSSVSVDGLHWEPEPGRRYGVVAFPDVVRLGSGSYRMYFQKWPGIGSAISTDGGLTFKDEGTRINRGLHGELDRDNIGASTTIRLLDGRFRMYYRGGIEDPKYFNGMMTHIFSAVSEDGLNFKPEEGIRIDSRKVTKGGFKGPKGEPSYYVDGPFIILEDGMFKLYFWGPGVCDGVCLATSKDGLNFDEDVQTVYSARDTPGNQNPGDPTLMQLKDGTWMMYFGHGPGEYFGIWQARRVQ